MPDYSVDIEKYTIAFLSLDKQVEILFDELASLKKAIADLQKKVSHLESESAELQFPHAR